MSVKLLTFNVWGLKYVSKKRKQRIQGVVDKLLDPSESYDVLAFQELWVQEDWDLIDELLAHLYPYRRWFKSGILTGPGLAILSKIPIKQTFLYRFPINGFPTAVNRGDWFVGKSLSVTVLANGMVICNSHMHAPYGETGTNAYVCHRSCQTWDICKIINLLDKAGYHIVLVGDLNCKPGSLPYKLLMNQTNLKDSWEVLKTGTNSLLSNQHISQLSPKDQILLGGITCDSQLNTWRADRKLEEACRLDYALINQSLSVVDASVRFVDVLPEIGCSYSDHFAYSCELKISGKSDYIETTNVEMIDIYGELLGEIENYEQVILPCNFKWRKYYFFGSIVMMVCLVILSGYIVPPFLVLVNISMMFISITGIINGIVGILWVKSELRNIQEVKLEVKDSLNQLTLEA